MRFLCIIDTELASNYIQKQPRMACGDCGSNCLQEIEGDLTCTSCGLVAQERVIKDEIDYVQYCNQGDYYAEEDDDIIATRERIGDRRLSRLQDKTATPLEKKYKELKRLVCDVPIEDGVQQCALRIIKETIEQDISVAKGQKKLTLVVLAIHHASRYLKCGIEFRNICARLGVDAHKAMTFADELHPLWRIKPWYRKISTGSQKFDHADKLRRVVHELSFVPLEPKVQLRVKQTAQSLYERVRSYPKFTSSKNHTVVYCCVYIACKICDLKVSKSKFCKEVGISLQTLNNQENAVQQALCMTPTHLHTQSTTI